MSDLYYFDSRSKAELDQRINVLVGRCAVVMEQVFQKKAPSERQAFERWLRGLLAESEDPFWILHEHPLYLVGDYLGIEQAQLETGPFANAYVSLAQTLNW